MHTDRKNYIFVDYENIRNLDLALIEGKPVQVCLIIGKHQMNLPKALVKQLLQFEEQVTLVENEHSGKNASDFVLVFEVARQACLDPKGFFHILSNDKGFDALVKHLHAQSMLAARAEEFVKIPVLVEAQNMSVEQLVQHFIARLRSHKGTRATRRKTLYSQINGHFNKALDEAKCESVIDRLVALKHIEISVAGAVTYMI